MDEECGIFRWEAENDLETIFCRVEQPSLSDATGSLSSTLVVVVLVNFSSNVVWWTTGGGVG